MNKIFDIIPPSEEKEIIPEIKIKSKKKEKIKKSFKLKFPKLKFPNQKVPTNEGEEGTAHSSAHVPTNEGEEGTAHSSAHVPKKIGFVFIGLFLIVVLLSSFAFSKADVVISPNIETLTFETELKVSAYSATDEKSIVGLMLEKDKSVTKEFETTGKTFKKAEGTVRVYNVYSSSSTSFRAGTRLMSDSGKIFVTDSKATIPGKPEYVDLKVIAAEAGEEYNIGPSMFSIPGLAGTALYDRFYGRSFESMKAGGYSSKVSDEDLVKAKDATIEEFKSAVKSEIISENSLNENYVILDDAMDVVVNKSFSLAKAGDETNKFNYIVEGKGKLFVFEKQKIEEFVKKYIASQLIDKEIQPGSLAITYNLKKKDFDKGEISFDLEIKAGVYSRLNETELKSSLYGKNRNEAIMLLSEHNGINKADVSFWPFWAKKIPNSPNRVQIKLNLDLKKD